MAVQQTRKSRSKRNMRRSNNSKATHPTLSLNKKGDLHLRHHLAPTGEDYRERNA